MGAPKNNQYWKLRSKHGRDRIIKDPETLAKAADEYFQWCDDNPIYEVDFRGKDLEKIHIPHPRPFLKEQFAHFCGVAQWRTITELADHKEKGKDFLQVITHVEKTIAYQKYQYAVVNMFNSNIVSKDLGLVDKQEHEHKGVTINLTKKDTDV